MNSLHIRPRFRQTVDQAPESLQEQLRTRLEHEAGSCEVRCFPQFISLRIPVKDQHFWSPQLNLSLEPTEDGKTLVEGIYGPNPNVWSLFLYGYFLLGFLAVVAAVVGVSQCLVDGSPWCFWLLIPILGGLAGLYVVAQFGQKLGARQTGQLRRAFEGAIGLETDIR